MAGNDVVFFRLTDEVSVLEQRDVNGRTETFHWADNLIHTSRQRGVVVQKIVINRFNGNDMLGYSTI